MASVSRLRRRAKGCENYNVRIGVFRKRRGILGRGFRKTGASAAMSDEGWGNGTKSRSQAVVSGVMLNRLRNCRVSSMGRPMTFVKEPSIRSTNSSPDSWMP